jgi:hypothetical protein
VKVLDKIKSLFIYLGWLGIAVFSFWQLDQSDWIDLITGWALIGFVFFLIWLGSLYDRWYDRRYPHIKEERDRERTGNENA